MSKGSRNLNAREKAREKARKIQETEKRSKRLRIIVPSILILALIVGVTFLFTNFSKEQKSEKETQEQMAKTKGEQITPKMIDKNGAFHVSSDGVQKDTKPNGNTRLDMFFDPQCPACGIVERGIGDRVDELLQQNEVDLFIYPVSFLDQTSTDNYSSRAASAVVTVAERSPEHTMDFVNRIFQEDFQPGEGASYDSVSDSDLAEAAIEVGVSEKVAKTIEDKNYLDWVLENSKKQTNRTDYFSDGFSTPAVFFNTEYVNNEATNYSRVVFDNSEILDTFNQDFNEAKK